MTDRNRQSSRRENNLGEEIMDLIQSSIDSMDFSGLNERIRDVVDTTREEVSRQMRMSREDTHTAQTDWKTSRTRNIPKRPVERKRQLPGVYSGPVQKGLGATGVIVFGGLSLGFGVAGLAMGAVGGMLSTMTIVLESIFLPLTLVSGFFLGRGIRTGKRVKRLQEYMKLWAGRAFINLEELCKDSGYSMKQIKNDVHYLLEQHVLPEARLDQKETCLILTKEAGEQYEAALQSQREREAAERRQQQEQEMQQREEKEFWENATEEEKELFFFGKQAENALEKVKQHQRTIISSSMQEKLASLELHLSRIFVCVKENPEKRRQTDRLMNYYLPSILKLLDVYENVEKQPVQGENIQKTKREIEDSLDTINEALAMMFDELFQDTAMDVSADVQVLETMLARDGWTKRPLQASEKEKEGLHF